MKANDGIMIVAGEASADAHAAALVRELRKLKPGLEVFGVGGRALEHEGAELFLDFSQVGVVGIIEIVPELGHFYRAYKALIKSVEERNPRGVVLLDLPDFNLFLADRIRKKFPDTKIIYYISPQVWGWRPGRVKKIVRRADAMLTLFPFEADIYREAGMDAEFVGHPLKDTVKASASPEVLRKEFGVETASPLVALLPGSRKAELEKYLPVLSEFVLRLVSRRPGAGFLLAKAPTVRKDMVERLLGTAAPLVKIIGGRTYDVLAASQAAVVASGTATLETAIVGTPMAVMGAVSNLTYYMAKPFVKAERFSLPNVISGKDIVPELIQHDLTPELLLEKILDLLDHPETASEMRDNLAEVKAALGPGGASRRAAEAVYKRLWPRG